MRCHLKAVSEKRMQNVKIMFVKADNKTVVNGTTITRTACPTIYCMYAHNIRAKSGESCC